MLFYIDGFTAALVILFIALVVILLRWALMDANEDVVYKLPSFNYPALSNDVDKYWVDPGVPVEVHGFKISSGMFYFGAELEAARTAGCMEISLVDPLLEVAQPSKLVMSLPFTDYPNYRWWSPEQRYVYLAWLANRTNVADVNENIVKLYVLGIERRLISDYYHTKLSSESALALIIELRRLKDELTPIYDELASRVSKLIDWAVYVHRDGLSELGETPSFSESSTLFRYKFSKKSVEEGIGPEEACEWVIHNNPELVPEFLTTYSSYFHHYFGIEFSELFPEGIKLNQCDIPMHLCYNPIHPGIPAVDVFLKFHTDPLWPSIHYKELKKIFISSSERTLALVEELNIYNGDPLCLLRVVSSLPKELAFDPDSQPFKGLYSFFTSLVSDSDQIRSLQINELVSFLSGSDQYSSEEIVIESQDLIILENVLTHMGLCLAPSPSRFLFGFSGEDCLVVYPGYAENYSDLYLEIATFITIIHGLAKATDNHDSDFIYTKMIEFFPDSKIIGRNALMALCVWANLSDTPPSRNSDKRIPTLSHESRISLLNCLRSALSEFVLPRDYKGKLQAIYKLLGMKEFFAKDIDEIPIRFS